MRGGDAASLVCLQLDSAQGDLGTLASVVTSLANLTDSLRENVNSGDPAAGRREEQSASEITRSVKPHNSDWMLERCLY